MNKDAIKIRSLTKKILPKAQSVKMKMKCKDLVQNIIQHTLKQWNIANLKNDMWLIKWLIVKAYTALDLGNYSVWLFYGGKKSKDVPLHQLLCGKTVKCETYKATNSHLQKNGIIFSFY